jgi:hypothetical protein
MERHGSCHAQSRIYQLPVEIARSGLVDHDGAAHCGGGHVIMAPGRVVDLIALARPGPVKNAPS